MQKQNKILLVLLLLLPGMFSCKKDFFDLAPYNAQPLTDAIKTEADLNAAANGMYNGLRSANLYGRTLVVKGDLMGDDVYLKPANSGRYLWARDLNQTAANTDMEGAWNSAYATIKNANVVIGAEVPASAIVDELKGEAYAIRALMHFELVKNFAKPYTVEQNALGVPIVTSFDQDALPTRNTVKEVYTQIVSDLNTAYSMVKLGIGQSFTILSTNTSRVKNTSYISRYAVKALQARVYQHMGDWAAARDAALEVVNNASFTLVEPGALEAYWKNPTPRTDKVETIFEVSSDAVGNAGINALAAFYDAFGGGYGDVWVTNEHYNAYSATDVRRNLIRVSTTLSAGNTVYTINKYVNNGNAADKDETKILRYADVLLILAEAYANLGNEAGALARLNEVAKKRDPSFAGYTSTGAQLKADILAERRKEFAFEGMRLWDFTRLALPIPNHTKSQFPTVLFPIEAGNQKLINAIPQSEIDANPNIRSQQNPGY